MRLVGILNSRYGKISNAKCWKYSVDYHQAHYETEPPQVHPFLSPVPVLSLAHLLNETNNSYQWSLYRLKLLSERFAIMAERYESKKADIGDDEDEAEVVNPADFESWVSPRCLSFSFQLPPS
jgi:hypothetical protein